MTALPVGIRNTDHAVDLAFYVVKPACSSLLASIRRCR